MKRNNCPPDMNKITQARTVSLISLFLLALALAAPAQQLASTGAASLEIKPTWFETMLAASQKAPAPAKAKAGKGKKLNQPGSPWAALREHFRSHQDLLEMSWEERDQIWNLPLTENPMAELARRYQRALVTSGHERGVTPEKVDVNVSSLRDLEAVRKKYLASRAAEYVVLTPKPSSAPAIHCAAAFGVRPGHPLLFRISASGDKPMKYAASGLPQGCLLDSANGILSGAIANPGDYPVEVSAENRHGKATQKLVLKVGDTIALTPPLGWNSWNCFARDVVAENIRQTGDLLVRSGLADFGWSYVNIDDCWMRRPTPDDPTLQVKPGLKEAYESGIAKRQSANRMRFDDPEIVGKVRDENGMILPNKDFADMAGLAGYLHSLGLRAGIYISPGPWTCQCYAGSYGYEDKDALQFALWGFDYLKYDWCGYSEISKGQTVAELRAPYDKMHQALKQVNRDIVYSLCQYGRGDVWEWGADAGGNCWRTTGDIRDTWESLTKIGFSQAGHEKFAGPGHWNDPDMLVVGYVGWSKNLRPTYLSPNEQYTHISLWSLLASPLLIGCDLTRLDEFTMNLLANGEVLAVNQDVLGRQASRIVQDKNVEVWVKELADGSKAVGIFNLGEEPVKYPLSLQTLGFGRPCTVRDLWRQKDLGNSTGSFTANINRHGVTLVKIAEAKAGR